MMVGGERIPYEKGLAGHSDADVLCHAIADALLGAVGLGDLGAMFPAERKWRNASGLELLREVHAALTRAGWTIENVDSTVVAQVPSMSPHRGAMVANIARALQLGNDQVSVKSTTTDALGAIGREEGIAAMAIASVSPLR